MEEGKDTSHIEAKLCSAQIGTHTRSTHARAGMTPVLVVARVAIWPF